MRPTCEDILKMKEVENHLNDNLVINSDSEDLEENLDLLKTIKLPVNL
jgi:hypothetical protein